MCCVGNDNDLREVTLGEHGAFHGVAKGAIFVDHTTASADIARELDAAAKKGGFGFLDAPVSGGQAGAENGVLTVMCGGDAATYTKAEPVIAAVHRRAEHELGITLRDVRLALPLFRYRAVDASGIVEHEVCPVYLAITDDEPELNPREVAEARWVDPEALGEGLLATPWAFSPWLVLQAEQLELFSGSARRRAS